MNVKTMQPRLLAMLVAFSVLAFTGTRLCAQTIVSGELAGTVTDPSGAPIPNTTVMVKNLTSGETRAVTTNVQGQYRLPLLRPGNYKLSAKAPGFSTTEQTATVSLGQVSNVGIKLQVGTVTETVDVTGEAPLLQSQNANVATTLTLPELENLPVGGSDMMAYLIGTPGVVSNTMGA